MKHRLLHVAAFLIGTATNCYSAESCVRYNDSGVVLVGVVELRTFYGPPNYGENPKTDSRETQAILKLDKILCTVTAADSHEPAESNQNVVTLIPLGNFSLTPYSGKRVRVKGRLLHAHNGHHRTPILIELRQLPELKV